MSYHLQKVIESLEAREGRVPQDQIASLSDLIPSLKRALVNRSEQQKEQILTQRLRLSVFQFDKERLVLSHMRSAACLQVGDVVGCVDEGGLGVLVPAESVFEEVAGLSDVVVQIGVGELGAPRVGARIGADEVGGAQLGEEHDDDGVDIEDVHDELGDGFDVALSQAGGGALVSIEELFELGVHAFVSIEELVQHRVDAVCGVGFEGGRVVRIEGPLCGAEGRLHAWHPDLFEAEIGAKGDGSDRGLVVAVEDCEPVARIVSIGSWEEVEEDLLVEVVVLGAVARIAAFAQSVDASARRLGGASHVLIEAFARGADKGVDFGRRGFQFGDSFLCQHDLKGVLPRLAFALAEGDVAEPALGPVALSGEEASFVVVAWIGRGCPRDFGDAALKRVAPFGAALGGVVLWLFG